MSRITVEVEKLKKNLKTKALNAKSQIEELAKKAQKDLSKKEKEVIERVESLVELVKSQEFMKDPRVQEITQKLAKLSDELIKELRRRVKPLKKKKSRKTKK